MSSKNTRVNPFTGAVAWEAIADEQHTIVENTDNGLYGYWLREAPQAGTVTVADVASGAGTGATYTVITSGTPQAGECRVDTASGFVWHHSSDDMMPVEVSYNGGGYVAHEDNLTNEFGGAGGGTTGVNYMTNSNAETGTDGWTDDPGGFVTVDRDVLTPLRSTASFVITAAAGASVGEYVTADIDAVDSVYTNQLFRVKFLYKTGVDYDLGACRVVVRDTTNSISYNLEVIPIGQGIYEALFSTTSSTAYELRFVAEVGGATGGGWSVTVDDVIFGPVETAYSTPVSDWVAYDVTIDGSTTAPTKANTTVIDQGYWRRVGDSMQITYHYYHNNNTGTAAGTGSYLFQIPSGYTIDGGKIEIGTSMNEGNTCGNAVIRGSGSYNNATPYVYNTTSIALFQDSTNVDVGSASFQITNTDYVISFSLTVPIAEFGDNAVALSLSRVEYVSNSDTSNANDTTSFQTGSNGELVPNYTGASGTATLIRKRVRFSRNFRHKSIEFNEDGIGVWIDGGSSYPKHIEYDGASYYMYGYWMEPVSGSDTDVDVYFYSYARRDTTGSRRDFAAEYSAGTRWRCIGYDQPIAVETPANTQVVHVKDVKTSGTAGGASSATTTQTRTLNTLENPIGVGWVSLSSNQITLQAGIYEIDGSAPAYNCGMHKTRLYNVTDATYDIEGCQAYADNSATAMSDNRSPITGVVNIASPKVFELRHYTTAAKASNGLGNSVSQGDEIFSVLKIRKIS